MERMICEDCGYSTSSNDMDNDDESQCPKCGATMATCVETEIIRFSADGLKCMVYYDGEPIRCPTQNDMDRLPVGPDLDDDDDDDE